MEETPYQRGVRILQGGEIRERNEWIEEILKEKDGAAALEALNNFAWGLRLLNNEEIAKLLEHISKTDDASIAAIAFGGSGYRFSQEQRHALIETVINQNDKIAAQTLIDSRREIPNDLKDEVMRVSKEGEKKEQKGHRLLF